MSKIEPPPVNQWILILKCVKSVVELNIFDSDIIDNKCFGFVINYFSFFLNS